MDIASVVAQKDRLVTAMRQAKYVDVAAAHGFEVRAGEASFASADLLFVDGEAPGPSALLGGATGSVALAAAGLAVVCLAGAVIARRRTRR